MHENKGLVVLLLVFAAGCGSFNTAGQVQSGRRALIAEQPETALAYFQQAAESDPNYIYSSARFQEGVWTYVGRAQYALGLWPEARRSFERALAVYEDDPMAQLYFGLAMLRDGDHRRGSMQLRQGLKSLSDWIEYLNNSKPSYAYWDPHARIRAEIDKTLAMAGAEKLDSINEIIASAEWVGRQMEEEIDKVRRDERRHFERERRHDFRRGISVGAGFGF